MDVNKVLLHLSEILGIRESRDSVNFNTEAALGLFVFSPFVVWDPKRYI